MTVRIRIHIYFLYSHKVEPFTESVTLFCPSVLEKKFLSTLVKLNMYLEAPLPHELDQNPNINESSRLYLDGDNLTLADCNLLPKLNIVKVKKAQKCIKTFFLSVGQRFRGRHIK